MKNILLPTDFSDNAWNAVVYALKLYADEPSTFYILNTVTIQTASYGVLSSKLKDTMKDNSKKELEALKKLVETCDHNANHEFHYLQGTEDIVVSMRKIVKEKNIDLIIMGTKGASGAKEFFFGSNTVQVVNHIHDCPVLVIPEDYDFKVPKQVAFPTGFLRAYSETELAPIKQLADLFNSKIRVVHINVEEKLTASQEENLEHLKTLLADYDHSFHWMPNYANKASEINDFIEELNIEALTMVNYKHSFIEDIIKEPVIKRIGFHPTVPFLVIPK
ncbi:MULTISPECIES: universal stress protein [Aestuariibaculum]|uniref:Universal stress protein n=1 Tax=Aestuariibaculum marinum TaxID=2683592 RepID=A0A8J6PXF7_9FLAO|nr:MULTISPECIES: universal stress protein [Aestuariibaculum]MBD0825350.1 universal stress protein [Aestuariibaculum marinum]WMI64738.1 universal stress protein [Aestuariibaculum sp. YM273]